MLIFIKNLVLLMFLVGNAIAMEVSQRELKQETIIALNQELTTRNITKTNFLPSLLRDYPTYKLIAAIDWMTTSGAWDKCGNEYQIKDLLECLKDCQTDRLGAVTSWMKSSGAWDKCADEYQIKDLLEYLKDYPADKLTAATNWMTTSGA